MDIINVNSALSALSAAPSPGSIQGAVSIKMLDNAINTNEALNQSLVHMMEQSVNPNIGGNFDMSV